jgi:thiol-disulfide isomerase/thioredoxin
LWNLPDVDDVPFVVRSPRRQVIVLSIVSVLGAVALVALFTTTGDDTASTARSARGETETERTLGTVDGIRLDGFGSAKRVELTSFRGKPLVLNYWASWCLFCIEEMPDFQSVYEDVEDDVAFLGVNIQDDHGQAKHLAKVTGVSYPLASDPKGDIFQKLKARSMPTTVFVNAKGAIVERFSGPLTADDLRERIRRHFGV